jgi:hypothetical protein
MQKKLNGMVTAFSSADAEETKWHPKVAGCPNKLLVQNMKVCALL